MIDVTRDIVSLTDFRRNADHVKRLQDAGVGGTLVLTVNGKAELVVITAAEYQRLWELADRMEELLAIRGGLDDVDAGRMLPLKEAFVRIRRKHGLSSSRRRDGTMGDS